MLEPEFVVMVQIVNKGKESKHLQYIVLYISVYLSFFACNTHRYTLDCGTIQPFENSGDFYVDNYVLAIINAVYTFVGAAHETLIEQCGASYSGVCGQFYSDPNTNTILYGKLTDVTFKDESDTTFSYTGKEGNTGREILLYDGSTLTKVYKIIKFGFWDRIYLSLVTDIGLIRLEHAS